MEDRCTSMTSPPTGYFCFYIVFIWNKWIPYCCGSVKLCSRSQEMSKCGNNFNISDTLGCASCATFWCYLWSVTEQTCITWILVILEYCTDKLYVLIETHNSWSSFPSIFPIFTGNFYSSGHFLVFQTLDKVCYMQYCKQYSWLSLTLYIQTSICTSSILFSTQFLRYWLWEFAKKSRTSIVVDHSFNSCYPNVWFRGDIVRRN